jgi:hypothetical protein
MSLVAPAELDALPPEVRDTITRMRKAMWADVDAMTKERRALSQRPGSYNEARWLTAEIELRFGDYRHQVAELILAHKIAAALGDRP